MDYDRSSFYRYVESVRDELWDRNIKFQNKYFDEIRQFCEENDNAMYELYPEHTDRYLKQCLYNLQEKADRGIITQEEWQKIENEFGDYLK